MHMKSFLAVLCVLLGGTEYTRCQGLILDRSGFLERLTVGGQTFSHQRKSFSFSLNVTSAGSLNGFVSNPFVVCSPQPPVSVVVVPQPYVVMPSPALFLQYPRTDAVLYGSSGPVLDVLQRLRIQQELARLQNGMAVPPPQVGLVPPANQPRVQVPEDAAGGERPARPKKKAARKPPPRPEPPAPRLPGPAARFDEEARRQLTLGREAFAGGEYARAVRRFQEAIAADPNYALGYFFLAQALYAQAKYQEAVKAVVDGLAKRPDWPATDFNSRSLYGPDLGAFQEHQNRLFAALNRFADDPFLNFLAGYQLWFDERRPEARSYFERSRQEKTTETSSVLFLQQLPILPPKIW